MIHFITVVHHSFLAGRFLKTCYYYEIDCCKLLSDCILYIFDSVRF